MEAVAAPHEVLYVERIAMVCHQVNKAYCEALGDFSQPNWNDAPDWQKRSAMMGVLMHMHQPSADPSMSHNSWMSQKVEEGWRYGEVKDAEAKTHPCIVPFNELPKEQQAKDHIFKGVVHAVMSM
jgi:hypothetical protein